MGAHDSVDLGVYDELYTIVHPKLANLAYPLRWVELFGLRIVLSAVSVGAVSGVGP